MHHTLFVVLLLGGILLAYKGDRMCTGVAKCVDGILGRFCPLTAMYCCCVGQLVDSFILANKTVIEAFSGISPNMFFSRIAPVGIRWDPSLNLLLTVCPPSASHNTVRPGCKTTASLRCSTARARRSGPPPLHELHRVHAAACSPLFP